MSQIISNPKNYTGTEMDQIFFRPSLTGPSALNLGLKVMYNMPVPTTLNFWRRSVNILKKYAKGWAGGDIADKYHKTISLQKVKSEMGYSAEDYFGLSSVRQFEGPFSSNLQGFGIYRKIETD
ncbi:MAG: hypothetical protein FWF54_00720 [Candidatus Azobacteroides sp.]|nr:hypothetical protein [Candidatus Azobacteroides sp.]